MGYIPDAVSRRIAAAIHAKRVAMMHGKRPRLRWVHRHPKTPKEKS